MKKAILVASHGSSYEDTRIKCIESVENSIKENFPDYIIKRAFTSGVVLKKLKNTYGIHIDTISEALEKLLLEGVEEVYVQPLLMIPGHEYDKTISIIDEYKEKGFKTLELGKPLLFDMKDYPEVVEALSNQVKDINMSDMIVMMGHGTDHYANALYMCLQHFIDKENLNITIVNIEGYPEISDISSKFKKLNVQSISLVPFMLVAGNHARKDMAGENDYSMVNIFKSMGYEVDYYIRGLGENLKIHRIFINKIKELIEEAN